MASRFGKEQSLAGLRRACIIERPVHLEESISSVAYQKECGSSAWVGLCGALGKHSQPERGGAGLLLCNLLLLQPLLFARIAQIERILQTICGKVFAYHEGFIGIVGGAHSGEPRSAHHSVCGEQRSECLLIDV